MMCEVRANDINQGEKNFESTEQNIAEKILNEMSMKKDYGIRYFIPQKYEEQYDSIKFHGSWYQLNCNEVRKEDLEGSINEVRKGYSKGVWERLINPEDWEDFVGIGMVVVVVVGLLYY